jgi:transcription-repair coupling factor (superfamily II helicase)
LRKIPVTRREELPEADLPVPAFLPDEYVPQERDRLNLYRKMSNIRTEEDIKALQDEMRDRFGPLPAPVFNLIRVLKIRVHLLNAHLRGISKSETEVLIRLKPGDRFADEDTAGVYARLNKMTDKRTLQHIALRPLDGITIDTRVISTAQLLRIVEEVTETLATVRGLRLLGGNVQERPTLKAGR